MVDNLRNDVDRIFIELNLRKVKCLFFQHIIVILNLRTIIFLMLAISLTHSTLFNFLETHNAANILKHKVCFKGLDIPSFVDLFITSRPQCFQNTTVFSTGLLHFHKMVATVLKASFSKAPRKEMIHRGYRSLRKINSNMN